MNYEDQKHGHNAFVTLGASNHTEESRAQNDFYATPPVAVYDLLEKETFNKNVWEPAAGMNHIVKILEKNGYNVKRSDIVKYVDDDKLEIIDFLTTTGTWNGDIITNPPFSLATQFVNKALELVKDGAKVAMFLKVQFLEGSKRYWNLFKDNPPKIVYVSVNRYGCTKDGIFNEAGNAPSAICYCWFIWEKGFKRDPIIKWMNY